jgi:simple sugar transport system permease protein
LRGKAELRSRWHTHHSCVFRLRKNFIHGEGRDNDNDFIFRFQICATEQINRLIRAVGEHPQAADTAGINVYALRYGAVIASGILSGLAGAFLSIGVGDTFIDGMTSGRGYIALAAMIFGKWTPIGAFIGCLIFGLGTSIAASNSTLSISQYVLEMVPYILTLVVLAGLVGRSVAPAADGVPYEPGGE